MITQISKKVNHTIEIDEHSSLLLEGVIEGWKDDGRHGVNPDNWSEPESEVTASIFSATLERHGVKLDLHTDTLADWIVEEFEASVLK